MYDAVIDADDTMTFGLSIPRGTALPRRLYPVRNLGVPMIHQRSEPVYQDVLLRYPKRNYTAYVDPSLSSGTTTNLPPAVVTPSLTPQLTRPGTIQLAWPSAAAGWGLEETGAFAGGLRTFWSLIPSARYQTNGGTIFYEEPVASRGSKFFRLRRL